VQLVGLWESEKGLGVRFFRDFGCFCSVICSGVGFVESGAFVVFVLRIWIGQLAVR